MLIIAGLSISAQYGLRDNNEASWTQILDQIEFMEEVMKKKSESH